MTVKNIQKITLNVGDLICCDPILNRIIGCELD